MTSVNAVIMDESVQVGMAWTMMAFKSYTYTTNTYCMFLKDWTGKAPVRLEYMVPALASANATKQNTSCMVHASWAGNIQSTSARATTMSACTCLVDVMLALCQHICPLLVAVEQGK
jgi:hypothetical protein